MKNIFRTMGVITCIAVMAVVIVGCSSKEESKEANVETYESEQVYKIEIASDVNKVIVSSTSDKQIEVSLNGYEGQLASLEENTLKINLPTQTGWIHLKESEALYVSIPDGGCKEVSITSAAGNITVEKANIEVLTIKSEDGNIKISGMEGMVSAKSEMGEIKTSLPIASDIKLGDMGVGGQINSQIGTENKSCAISLYTNTGDIILE